MSKCRHRTCNNEVDGRKHYCSDYCKFWETSMRKDDEKGMMPKSKRTNQYFWFYENSSYGRGQGKRIGGGIVVGALTGISVPNYSIRKATEENLDAHFNKPCVEIAHFGDGSRLSKQSWEALKIVVGIKS